MPCVTLEDVARDALRTELFCAAFPAEQAALARRFALLALVRRYKALAGRRDALLLLAQQVVDEFLDPDHALLDAEHAALGERIRRAVAAGRAPLDLLSGLEARVAARLAHDHFPRFVASEQYARLCEALRARRELPLAALLVDARRTQLLERFLLETAPAAAGNLRFWVDVQTTFLPLLQVSSAFSPARFEQTQRAVRRVYNQFLADRAPRAASRVPDSVRAETLARIMQLQAEPFSPPRYAALFRAAQDCVWQWLLADVYPRFRRSDLYVRLVVEAEDLEADRQLRRLSDHVRVGATKTSGAKTNNNNSAVVVVPVSTARPTLGASTCRVLPAPTRGTFARALEIPRDGARMEDGAVLLSIGFYALAAAAKAADEPPEEQRWTARCELFCSTDTEAVAAETHPTYLEYCWDQFPAASAALPGSPTGQRAAYPLQPPLPTFRDFVVPVDASNDVLYGIGMTQWTPSGPSDGDKSESAWLPRVVTLITRKPMWGWGRQLLLRLESLVPGEASGGDIDRAIRAVSAPESRLVELNPQFEGFSLRSRLVSEDFPIQSAFRDISAPTFLTMLSCVLVGKSVILVSEELSTLTLVGESLRRAMEPFRWTHFFLPFCPREMAAAIADHEAFKEGGPPFIIGFNAVLSVQKQKDASGEQRHRLKDSIYNIQRATLQLQHPAQPGGSATLEASPPLVYPAAFLQTQAIVIDVDSDDVYIPERADVPEFPQSLVRSFEGWLSQAIRSPSVRDADSFMFSPWKYASPFAPMLQPSASPEETGPSTRGSDPDGAADGSLRGSLLGELGAQLAVMQFLESLLGDVVFHFCSFRPNLSGATAPSSETETEEQPDEYILFEADSFLDARMELGCRDFFRQCFQTETFRQFLLAQHDHFSAGGD